MGKVSKAGKSAKGVKNMDQLFVLTPLSKNLHIRKEVRIKFQAKTNK